MKLLSDLLNRLGISPRPSASDEEIADAERRTGLTFTNELRDLYRFTDGVTIDDFSLKILPLKDVLAFHRMLREAGYPQIWGYLPFTDSNDSNPYCVCCRAPLTGYVALVSHDNSAKLSHRGLHAFFVALSELLEPYSTPDDWEECLNIEELRDDFTESETPAHEKELSKELTTLGNTYGEPDTDSVAYVERADAFRFAATLCG